MATSTYLSRTGTSGNQKTFTFAGWFKIQPGVQNFCWTAGVYSSTIMSQIYFESDYKFNINHYDSSGSQQSALETSRLFRDTAAWYHVVVAMDTTQSVAADRTKLYINGVQETVFTTESYPALNYDTAFNTTVSQSIGRRDGSTTYYDGNMAHLHAADGLAYAPTVFGEVDSTSGIWIAKTSPSVTYGTNGGFYKFASGAFGTDSSGEDNTMTVTGTMTANKDNPDNNYATWNPLYMPTSDFPVFTNANTTLESQDGSGDYWGSGSTLGMTTGKWYAEFKVIGSSTNKPSFGITQSPGKHAYDTNWIGNKPYDYVYLSTGEKVSNDVPTSSWGDTFTTDDIIGVAVDLDNNKIYFAKNGTWQASGDPTSGSTGTGAAYTITSVAASDMTGDNAEGAYYFAFSDQSTGSATTSANFGNGYFGTTVVSSAGTSSSGDDSIWEYDCPTGYYGLNSTNLATYG